MSFVKRKCYCQQIFFVLRKKDNQVSILHLYHHTVTPLETWVCVKFIAGKYSALLLALSNVHIERTEIEGKMLVR